MTTTTTDERARAGFPLRRPTAGTLSSVAAAFCAVALGGWIAVSTLRPFTPGSPDIGLDASWVAALGEAADRGLLWGQDIAFTYGPASPLVTGYLNAAYLTLTLPLLLAMCLAFGVSTALSARAAGGAALAIAVAAVGAIAPLLAGHPDCLFLAFPVAPFLLCVSRERSRVAAPAMAATAFAFGMLGMVKMTYPMTALPLLVIGDAAAIRRGRLPFLCLPYLLGFAAADLLYGQHLSDLPLFLRQQGEVVAGYGEAMAVDGSRAELGAYLLAAAVFLALTAAVEWAAPRGSRARLAVPLGLAWVLFVLLKVGFVRQDGHALYAWHGFALVAALVAAARFQPRPALAVAVIAVAGAALVGLDVIGPNATPATRDGSAAAASGLLVEGPGEQIAAAVELARDPAGFARELRARRAADIRKLAVAHPWPRLEGSVDVLPSQQGHAIVSGYDYRPRPTVQEYTTYTPALVAADRAFLQGPRAPDWVLFGPEFPYGGLSIDGRYSNLAEGALWLDLLRLYRPERRVGDLVALRRRAEPAPVELGAARDAEVGFDEPVAVAPLRAGGDERAVLAEVAVRLTPLGRVAAFLLKPPPLSIQIRFADGREQLFRFVSGIGASGFVLSPTVWNASEFVALADGSRPGPDRVVTAFSVHAPPRLRWLFDQRIVVSLRPVLGSGGKGAVAAPRSAWAALADSLGRDPASTDPVAATPPAAFAVPVAGLSRLDLGFGLAGGEPGAEVVCFAAVAADGSGRALWRRCLDRAVAADRARQPVSLAVPPGTSEVTLELTCRSGCEEGVDAYWAPPP